MESFSIGEVVFVNFPYSNFKKFVLRPALVCAVVDYGDVILCQITSKAYSSKNFIKLTRKDFEAEGLPVDSYIRPDKLFTVDAREIKKKVAKIKKEKIFVVFNSLQKIFSYN